MSASSIPPLSTLLPRGGLRGRGGRGRGRFRSGVGGGDDELDSSPSTSVAARKDQTVQGTDNDAASSRASAVITGYLTDPYAMSFGPIPPPRRYPLINRGTYVRTTALDRLIIEFLTTSDHINRKKQIISLGAGSDTRFFRLAADFSSNLVYHEIDFPVNAAAKVAKVLATANLKAAVQLANPDPSFIQIDPGQQSLYSASLNIHPLDLRALVSPSTPPSLPNIDPSLPTLLLSECCLTYLPLDSANSILTTLLSHYLNPSTPAAALLYEPILPGDPFGQTMVSNLASRSIEMPSLHALPTLESHRARLRDLGLKSAKGRSVRHVFAADGGREAWITPQERARVEGLEWLDEVEEWNLLAGHYCVVWGWRGGEGDDVFGRAWTDMEGDWREEEKVDDERHRNYTGPR